MDLTTLTVRGLHRHLRARVDAALAAAGAAGAAVPLETPPDPEMGHLGFPCFPLARLLRKAPPKIAAELAAAIAPDDIIAEAAATGPYVNLRLRPEALAVVTVADVLAQGARYGAGGAAEPGKVLVEFSAPNTNKPLHLGHLRNTLLGAAVARLLTFHGHEVTRVNLINDRGVHICKTMLAYRRWGDGVTPESAGKKGDHLVGDLYVRFEKELAAEYAAWQGSDEARALLAAWLESDAGRAARAAREKDPAAPDPERAFFAAHKDAYFNRHSRLGAEVRRLLRAWEAGDPDVVALWQKMNAWVLAGFEDSYRRMGVGFDLIQYESETYTLGKSLVEEGLEAGLLRRRDDGAVVCDLDRVGLAGEKVLLRADGTSVYMTQDLGTALERFQRFHPDRLIYVVGDEQNYHFQVLFKVLGLLRPGLAERCHHLAYGMIRLPDGKMKSREGTVVDADELMDEMHALAREETERRAAEGKAHTEGLDAAEIDRRAEAIGMAALKYYLLRFSPRTSFEYDPKESIDFLGQTGPYCLFNYARTRSLLRRAGGTPPLDPAAIARLRSDRERDLVRRLMAFPDAVDRAARTLDPSRVTEYLFDLCKAFAFIFTDKANHPIVTCDDPQLRRGRLLLVAALSHTLAAGLGLLGIEVLEEM